MVEEHFAQVVFKSGITGLLSEPVAEYFLNEWD